MTVMNAFRKISAAIGSMGFLGTGCLWTSWVAYMQGEMFVSGGLCLGGLVLIGSRIYEAAGYE
jgi:hypothetical protein